MLDCNSIQLIVDNHKFLYDSKDEAVSRILKAELDLDFGMYYPNFICTVVAQVKVREAAVAKLLKYLYVVFKRLGLFDGHHQYRNLGKKDVCTDAYIELAPEAVRQDIIREIKRLWLLSIHMLMIHILLSETMLVYVCIYIYVFQLFNCV